jgi:hypothetical protein
MGELKYHMVRSDDTFLSSEIKITMEIGAFTKYIRDNGIENVFVSKFSGEFVKLKDKSPSFNDSIIFFTFDCNKIMMLWTDSLGFSSIEDYEESIKNQIFTMIIYFKQQYPDLEQWQDSIGTIYEHLRLVGYKESDDVKDSVEFFQGYLFSYLEYKKVRDYGKDHCFNNITEMINSQRGGFENCEDYNEAEYLKAPNIQTLRSMRLTMEIEHNFHFVDYTSSLLFAVMLKIRRRLKDPEKGELKSKLLDIRRELFMHMPRNQYKGFRNIETDQDLENILESEFGFSTIGSYSKQYKEFNFFLFKIYIDGSNIIHNGQREGGKTANLKYPKISYLEDCIRCLGEEEIKVTGVYLDYSKNESLKYTYPEQFQEYQNLKRSLKNKKVRVTETVDGETADDRLISKLKDDETCYVISNDTYRDYDLSKSDKRRVINFERSEGGKYRFFARNDKKEEIELKKLFEVNEDKFDKYERVTSLKSIGTWPYPDKCDYFEILTFLGEQFKA